MPLCCDNFAWSPVLILLCAAIGAIKREPPFGGVRNHRDETAAYTALFALVSGLGRSVPA